MSSASGPGRKYATPVHKMQVPVSGEKKKAFNEASVPHDVKELRACMICSLIKTHSQFEEEGCDNCERVLSLAGRSGSSYSYTSANFEGMISVIEPKASWVAKWQHISNLKKGVYAVSVYGQLPKSLKLELDEAGFSYRCRDKRLTADELAQREHEGGQGSQRKHRRFRRGKKKRATATETSEAATRSQEEQQMDEDQGDDDDGHGDEQEQGNESDGSEDAAIKSGDEKEIEKAEDEIVSKARTLNVEEDDSMSHIE